MVICHLAKFLIYVSMKIKILHKLLINEFMENEISLSSKGLDNDESEKIFISPGQILDMTSLIL